MVEVSCRCTLAFHWSTVGQPIVERARPREDPIRHKRPSIHAEALSFVGSKHTTDDTARVGDRIAVAGGQRTAELGRRIECRRTLGEIEDKAASVGVSTAELPSTGKFLRDGVAEDRAEHGRYQSCGHTPRGLPFLEFA